MFAEKNVFFCCVFSKVASEKKFLFWSLDVFQGPFSLEKHPVLTWMEECVCGLWTK